MFSSLHFLFSYYRSWDSIEIPSLSKGGCEDLAGFTSRIYTYFFGPYTPFLRPSLETFFAHLANASSYTPSYALVTRFCLFSFSVDLHERISSSALFCAFSPCYFNLFHASSFFLHSLYLRVVSVPYLPKSQHHHPSSANPQNAAPATSTPIALPHALRPQPATACTASILARHHQRQRRPQHQCRRRCPERQSDVDLGPAAASERGGVAARA